MRAVADGCEIACAQVVYDPTDEVPEYQLTHFDLNTAEQLGYSCLSAVLSVTGDVSTQVRIVCRLRAHF